jgi:hypothetical protein
MKSDRRDNEVSMTESSARREPDRVAVGEILGADALAVALATTAGDIEADHGEKQADQDGPREIGDKVRGLG